MKNNRAQTLTSIIESEGPETNISPDEPGGASKYGVSVVALSDYNKRHGKPPATIEEVSQMTEELAKQIYDEDWLTEMRFDELPSGVDYRLADISVNLGREGGATCLQLALGMWPLTGQMDERTVQSVASSHPEALIFALSAAWIAKKHESKNWPTYGHGWSNRNGDATARAVKMVGS